MEKGSAGWTLAQLAEIFGGAVEGDGEIRVLRAAPAGDDDPEGITFATSEKYLEMIETSSVAAVIVGDNLSTTKPAIRVKDARLAFGMLLGMTQRPLPLASGIHPTAVVSSSAAISETAQIGPYCVVEAGAMIEDGAKIHPHCYVGENCRVGQGAVLYPRVVLYQDVQVGARSILHSGCVIGADGFGFLWDGKKRVKIPQVGSVILGDEVEIGATIDRATAGATKVGNGTKIDNLVQVGHNCRIGEHGAIAGQTGISGSTQIGDRVIMGGGVGTNDHIKITHDVIIGGRSGIDRDITEPGEYFGTPARPVREAIRAFLLLPKLPELFSRIRALEKRLKAEEGE
jgi:UDP-3-O-[3-hydroxymyristoyl] glucosamine N-acyltransferase